MRAMLVEAPFIDVGTPADYLEAALAVARTEGKPSTQIGNRSSIDATARVVDSVIWDDVAVGRTAVIERCVVADSSCCE